MTSATFATAPRYTVTRAALHISNGNSKLSGKNGRMLNFSKIPGAGFIQQKNGRQICSVSGTCNGTCPGCYAVRTFQMCRPGVVAAWAENTLLARDPKALYAALRDFFSDTKPLYDGEPFRIHQAGDFETAEELRVWDYVAENNPGFAFYTYTKNFGALREFMQARNWEKPANINIMLSECDGYPAPDDLKEYFPVCVWDQGQPEAADLPHCPAVSAPEKPGGRGHNTGITCNKCKLCTRGISMAIHNH